MGKILRFIFCYDAFEKERLFITTFYEKKKNSSSGRFILKKIMGIMEETIKDCIVLYLLSKKKEYMIGFYLEKIDYYQQKIKYSETLKNNILDSEMDKHRGSMKKKVKKVKRTISKAGGKDAMSPKNSQFSPTSSISKMSDPKDPN